MATPGNPAEGNSVEAPLRIPSKKPSSARALCGAISGVCPERPPPFSPLARGGAAFPLGGTSTEFSTEFRQNPALLGGNAVEAPLKIPSKKLPGARAFGGPAPPRLLRAANAPHLLLMGLQRGSRPAFAEIPQILAKPRRSFTETAPSAGEVPAKTPSNFRKKSPPTPAPLPASRAPKASPSKIPPAPAAPGRNFDEGVTQNNAKLFDS